MAFVLVKAATGPVMCGHGGTVKVPTAPKLTVQSKKVLLSPTGSVTVSGCTTVPSTDSNGVPQYVKCTTATVTTTQATKLTVGGNPLMVPVAGTSSGMVNY